MDTFLVRLKTHDPRRGQVLKRFVYKGIVFQEDRGWYRVSADVAAYLRKVRQREHDPHAPLAFDVATEEDARAVAAKEESEAKARTVVGNDIKLSVPRPEKTGGVTTADLPPADSGRPTGSAPKSEDPKAKKERGA